VDTTGAPFLSRTIATDGVCFTQNDLLKRHQPEANKDTTTNTNNNNNNNNNMMPGKPPIGFANNKKQPGIMTWAKVMEQQLPL
jgi:hypothetical protein